MLLNYGAKILSIVQEKDYLVITIKQQQLKLTLAVLQKDGHPLMAPHKGLMNRVIREKASTEIYVTLQKNNETLLEQKGIAAGFEEVDHLHGFTY